MTEDGFNSSHKLLLWVKATRRGWGNKIDRVVTKITIAGVPFQIVEFDGWECAYKGDDISQYYRFCFLCGAAPRDERPGMDYRPPCDYTGQLVREAPRE